jgi:DNA-binding PadR family transcriptional regulator
MQGQQIPEITHLQFLVLGVLLEQDRPGRVIRRVLTGYGVRRSAPAFYQMMSRLEGEGLVEGWYEQITIGDQAVTERRYRITVEGSKAWKKTRRFYDNVALAVGKQRWSDA